MFVKSLPIDDHGGQLDRARARFPDAPEPWIDLSTGINPWPYPVPPLDPEVWHRLPTNATLETLNAAAARAYGAPSGNHVAAAPGSQALIQLLPRLEPAPARCRVIGPTYAEHIASWSDRGHAVFTGEPLPTGAIDADETVVVVNPNNPDGRRHQPEALLAVHRIQSEHRGRLVVDEAFADVAPELSLAGHVGARGLIVLRSFGKFFGLAGLRLGFALGEPRLMKALTAELGPWAVSGPAAAIGIAALNDRDWIIATRHRLAAAAARLDTWLNRPPHRVIGGTDLFRLVECPDAARYADALGHAGILVRRFAAQPTWLRFGLPPDETAWHRLTAVTL